MVAGLGLGLVRLAQGGHFLSDVLFAGLVMYFVVQVHRGLWVSMIMLRRRGVEVPLRPLVPPA
jgi:lipid A 4'-phosphatase